MRRIITGLLLLFALSASANAAEFAVSSATGTVNCASFCSGACSGGDILNLEGGTRGKLTLQNCSGAPGNHIIVRNDPTDTEPVQINHTCSGCTGAGIEIDDVEYLTIDGTQGWVGGPSGVCGIDTDKTEGRTQCGIRIFRSSGTVNSQVQMIDSSTRFTIKGVEVDGNFENWPGAPNNPSGCCGIAFAMYDRSYDCEGGNGTTDTANCTEWREDIIIENNYIHDTFHEGVYFGPNYMSNLSIYDLPNRNITIRNNLVEDAGWACLQLKTSLDGTNTINHNVVRNCGIVSANNNDFGHSICIQGDGNKHISIHNNWMENCGAGGIAFRSQNVTANVFPTMTCEAYNNVILRAGFILNQDGVQGTVVNNTNPPTMECNIYNNTIVDPSNEYVSNGNVPSAFTATENIMCGAQQDNTNVIHINNSEGSCVTRGFNSYVGDNFTLDAGSSAVDAGLAVSFPSDDYLGVSRPQGAAHDLGAYEYFDGGPPPVTYECNDGIDNDLDTFIDYPDDPGCGSTVDNDESDDPLPPGNGTVVGKPSSYSADISEPLMPDHCWMMDEGSGASLADYCAAAQSEVQLPMTITGPDWSTDTHHGDYLDFIKANSDYGEITGVTTNSSQVVCSVIRIAGNDGLDDRFWSMTDNTSTDWIFSKQITPGGFASVGYGFGGTWSANNGPTAIEDNEWHWFCVKVDDTQADVSVDGEAWDEGVHALNGSIAAINTYSVGRMGDSTPSNYADFEITAMFWWNGSDLTSADMATIWNGDGNIWPQLGIDASGGGGPSPSPGNSGDYPNAAP